MFRRRGWFQGRAIHGKGVSDIGWFKPDGNEMTDEDWDVGYAKSVGVFLNGLELSELNDSGGRIRDNSFLLLFNASHDVVTFTLPERSGASTEIISTPRDRIPARPSVFQRRDGSVSRSMAGASATSPGSSPTRAR